MAVKVGIEEYIASNPHRRVREEWETERLRNSASPTIGPEEESSADCVGDVGDGVLHVAYPTIGFPPGTLKTRRKSNLNPIMHRVFDKFRLQIGLWQINPFAGRS